MQRITGRTGRKYAVDDTAATVYNEAKARLLQYSEKVNLIENLKDIEIPGLTDDDSELAIALLKDFYTKKIATEELTIDHIVNSGDDVTGKP